jgi:hypothetical protein
LPWGKNPDDNGYGREEAMIITVSNGQAIDTAKGLNAAERHILQKLLLWETMAKTVEEFREKIGQALASGWNNSGPISGSRNLKLVIQDLEKRVRERLQTQP